MTKIISFVSRKGGTGKTTNAINVATTLAAMRKKVILIETDINYTLSALRLAEIENLGALSKQHPEIITTEETSVVKEIKTHQQSGQYDYIIVDSAGNTSEYGTNRLCVNSDLVVVPTTLSDNDLLVARQTLEYIEPAKQENQHLKVVILPTRIHSRTKVDTVKNTLKELNVDVLDIFVPSRKVYTKVSTINAIIGYKEIVKKLLKKIEEA